jgi:hypothetical protein|tara:strand:+ start:1364 stop:1651 length:288 start_codon:yes stop_codon:yes gene_type:complete
VHDPNFRRLYGVMVPIALWDGGSDADVLAWARADCEDWTYEPDEEEAALMRELERMEDGDFEGIDEVPTEVPLVVSSASGKTSGLVFKSPFFIND